MDEQKRVMKLLQQLNHNEAFNEWRDLVAKPVIDQLERDLGNCLTYPEATLKAKILHLNFVKELFYRIFEDQDALDESKE